MDGGNVDGKGTLKWASAENGVDDVELGLVVVVVVGSGVHSSVCDQKGSAATDSDDGVSMTGVLGRGS